jgi:excisionase family DNA binding protein
MAENEGDQLLPVSEVAKRFSVSDQTIYRWIDEGILPVVKVRRLLRIRSSDVDRLLEEASQPARTPGGGWTDAPPDGRRMK